MIRATSVKDRIAVNMLYGVTISCYSIIAKVCQEKMHSHVMPIPISSYITILYKIFSSFGKNGPSSRE